ncbi:sigma-70 family RNA polymerase sigma factor [Pseudonocardia sp. GCM10023141]|uniref:sigma-70 family RNA polymerase sigma factor n=1 Tax=Pseudonocardia sp. GCM10023141 TaxID=3252653 RepID=UPI00360E1B0D
MLRAAADGDDDALALIVERYTEMVWSIARSFRLAPADAADAAQTTWLRLVEHLDRITGPDRLPGWLATTVRRECLHQLRRSRREQVGLPSMLPDSPPDDQDPVDARLLRSERDLALHRASESIRPRYRQLLRALMASPPPTYAAMSRARDIPIGSIGPSRRRALDTLRLATRRS